MGITDGWTAAQVRAAERPLLGAGVPLMARAAAGLAWEVLLVAGPAPRVLVLAGSGDNGGDALLAAAILARRGCPVVVVRLGRRVHAPALADAVRAGAVVLPRDVSAGRIAVEAGRAQVVLDGLLGTGASGALRAPARQVVARLLESAARPRVLAVDLPSGVGPDDGEVHPPVLRAAATVTFGAVKAGLLAPAARVAVGRVVLVDIGLGAFLR